MSVALGANRWASRVVVVLQLAAWSAVGIVLLQKGVSSLQKSSAESRNATKANQTETVANLIMTKIPEDLSHDFQDFDISEGQIPPRIPEFPEIRKHPRAEDDEEVKDQNQTVSKTVPPVIPISSLTANHLSSDQKTQSNNDKKPSQDRPDRSDREEVTQNSPNDDEHVTEITTPNYSSKTTEKYDKVFEARKKIRLSNLSGGGAAAAAVAMVAVGAVMLVLGPVVIILRALDERRQERRFLKLSGQDDLPPSYEQATLMDEAPRYSTLSLNTIGCSTAVAVGAGTSSSAAEVTSLEGHPRDPEAAAGGDREV